MGVSGGAPKVGGEDQLFSFLAPLNQFRNAAISGAGGHIVSTTPPADQVWVVNNIIVRDRTSPLIELQLLVGHEAASFYFGIDIRAIAANERAPWSGLVYLVHEDVIQVNCIGSLAEDSIDIWLTGYIMSVEA